MQTTTTPPPNGAKHHWNEDGTVTVTYTWDRGMPMAVTYESPREASIESSLRLFPGTSREWLERMHS